MQEQQPPETNRANLEQTSLPESESQERLKTVVFPFFERVLKQDPDFDSFDRKVRYAALLIYLGLKDEAEVAIGDFSEIIVDHGPAGQIITEQAMTAMYRQLGDEEAIKHHLASWTRAIDMYHGPDWRARNGALEVATTYFEHGMLAEGKRTLLDVIRPALVDHGAVIGENNLLRLLQLLVKYDASAPEAHDLWLEFCKSLMALPVKLVDQWGAQLWQIEIRNLGILIQIGRTLHADEEKINRLLEILTEIVTHIPTRVERSQPLAIATAIETVIAANREDLADELIEYIKARDVDWLKTDAMVTVALEFANQGNLEKANEYWSNAKQTLFTHRMDLQTFKRIVQLLAITNKRDEMLDIVHYLVKTRIDVVNLQESVSSPVGTLCAYGFDSEAEELVLTVFARHRAGLSDFGLKTLLGKFGTAIHLPLLATLFAEISPNERTSVLAYGSSQYQQEVDVKKLLPFIQTLPPTNVSLEEMTPYLINVVDKGSWKNLKEHILQSIVPDDPRLTDKLCFLLLEYSSLTETKALFAMVSGLREKISLRQLDTYKALLNGDAIHDLWTSKIDHNWIVWLEALGVVSEAKHFLYLDTQTLSYLKEILSGSRDDDEWELFLESLRFVPKQDLPLELATKLTFLSRIFKEKTSYVSSVAQSVLYCMRDSEAFDITDSQTQGDVFQAIDMLGGITPTVFEKFRAASSIERVELAKAIKRLQTLFYQNVTLSPESTGLDAEDFDEMLAEYITLLMRPVGFSSERVREFCESLQFEIEERDLPQELRDHLKFGGEHWHEEKGCYIIDIDISDMAYGWKEGKQPAANAIDLAHIFAKEVHLFTTQPDLVLSKLRAQALQHLIKNKASFQPTELRLKTNIDGVQPSALAALCSFFTPSSLEVLGELQKALTANDATAFHEALIRAKDVLGYKSDAGHQVEESMERMWKGQMEAWLGQLEPLLRNDLCSTLKVDAEVDNQILAEQLYALFKQHVLTKVVELLAAEERKLTIKGTQDSSSKRKRVRIYPSKNLPSFFAKAAAGLCTSEDISRYVMLDHFHMNMVDDETDELMCNTQMYMFHDDRRLSPENLGEVTSLLQRGINPTDSYRLTSLTKGVVEANISIAQELAAFNGMTELVFSEALAEWHADSNNQDTAAFLRREYLVDANSKELPEPFPISSDQNIKKVHVLWTKPALGERVLPNNVDIQVSNEQKNLRQKLLGTLSRLSQLFKGEQK